MPAAFVQTSFTGGRWSPYSQGRYDDPRYRTGLSECQNMLPLDTHALTRRSGTQFAGTTRNGKPGRVIPFSFEDYQPYTAELTDGHIRFRQGANLLLGADAVAVSSISTATPAVVTVASSVSWANGDIVTFQLLDTTALAAYPLVDRQFMIGSFSGTTFQIFSPSSGNPIDGTTLGWTNGLNVTVSRVTDITSPYVNGLWSDVRPVQNETNMLLLEGQVAPQLMVAVPPTVSAPASFTIAAANLIDGPYLDPFPNSTVTPSALNGLVSLTLGTPAYDSTKAYNIGDYVTASSITYVSLQSANAGNTPSSSAAFWQVSSPGAVIGLGGFQPTDIGRHVRLLSEPPDWVTGTTYAIGNVVKFNGSYWTALKAMTGASPSTGNINPNQPGNTTDTWAVNAAAALWTWGKITSLPTSGAVNPSTGTAFGDMTGNGGLAAAFDGVTSQTYTQSAQKKTTGTGYVGLNFGVAIAVTSVKAYPSTDRGFIHSPTANITLNLRAKSTLPANSSDGTLLATTRINGTLTVPVALTSNDQSTTWAYIWLEINTNGGGGATELYVADLQLFGTGAVPAGSIAQIQLIGSPLLYTSTIRTWRLGLYTATLDPNTAQPIYPTCGCYHEGRLWLGGAVRNRFDASISNGFTANGITFSPTAPDLTVGGANGISYTFDSSDLNEILWFMPGLDGIVAGTRGGEWLISGPAPGAMTPTNIAARRVTTYGCANVEPRRTGLTTVLVQRYQRKILEYVADAFSGKYAGPNLAEDARDLCASGIAEIAYQQELTPTLWVRMNDGSLAGMLYRRTSLITSQPAEFIGWHHHPLGSGRLVESICTGPSPDGLLDALTMVTNDPVNGIRHVEVLTDIFDEDANFMTAWMLDGAVSPVSGTTVNGACVFGGLSHLNGKTVTVMAAGIDCGDFLVSSGAVTVPYGSAFDPKDKGLFTQRWMTELSAYEQDFGALATPIDGGLQLIPVLVGSTYTSRGQILRLVSQDQTGARTGPAFGMFRRINTYAIALFNAQKISIGTVFGKLLPVRLQTKGGTALAPTELYSGVTRDTIQATSDMQNLLAWEVSRPFPATVLAVGGFLAAEES